jgi:hypothetical protein
MSDNVKHPEAYLRYLNRIGATVLNFRKAMVKETRGPYYIEKSIVTIHKDGSIKCTKPEHAPTKEEAEEIAAALAEISFPVSINATEANAKDLIAQLIKDGRGKPEDFFLLRTRKDGNKIKMIQQRVDNNGAKYFQPHSLWSDGKWRALECDDKLPFWKPREKRSGVVRIMVHEGAKAAAHCDWLVNDRSPEAKEARANHPWFEELANYEHWGLIGGAMAPHRADYGELKKEGAIEVVYVCDNDWPGRTVLKEFSRFYEASLKGIMFDERFKESFDLADEIPEAFFKELPTGRRYRGPQLREFVKPATTATELVAGEEKAGKDGKKKAGKPIVQLTRSFREEWYHTVSPEVFIHADEPNKLLNAAEFNSLVRPFSAVDDTARLVRGDAANKMFKIHYLPGAPSGMYGNALHGQFFNTYFPPKIKPLKGDASPFLDFIAKLIPSEKDRKEVLRWCATLIARPEIKMLYGLLMISEVQGVGKTTLGEKILAPLVGIENVSAPSESDIVESQFNSWIAHRRLAVVNEIYAGASAKAYNKLKSVITDRTITVNKKHQATYEIENWVHVFACSNSTRALRLSADDRRWLVPKVTEVKQELGYWAKLNDWIDNGGLSIIFNWAKEFVLDNHYVMPGETAPRTDAKDEMVDEGKSSGQLIAKALFLGMKNIAAARNERYFITDMRVIEVIKNRLYDGRSSDKLEKASTIRAVAKEVGLHIGTAKTRKYSAGGMLGRIVSTGHEGSLCNPGELIEKGYKEFDINVLDEMDPF